MSRVTRDGTAKPVPRNQILRRERSKELFPCSADHEQDWQPYAVDLYSAVCDDHTCIRTHCSVYAQLPPVLGAPWGCCGHASGIYVSRIYGSVGVQLTRLRALCRGTLTSECVWKNLNATVLQVTCTMQQSSQFFFIRVFKGVLSSEFVD